MSWQAYADHWSERAIYEEGRGDTHAAEVARRKAQMGARAVRAAELREKTGVDYCVCCLKPLGRGGSHAP